MEAAKANAQKPVFQRFMEANNALVDCFAAVPKETLQEQSSAALDSMCAREKNEIKRILESNQMTMTQVVKDRVELAKRLETPEVRFIRHGE